jgi:hypothetical protein
MKTIAFLVVLTALPAFAQEAPGDGSTFEALKLGNWVAYRTSSTRDLIDLTVMDEKPAGTTIKRHWEDLNQARATASAAYSRHREAVRALRAEQLTPEERAAKEAVLDAELQQTLEPLGPARRRETGTFASRRQTAGAAGRPDFPTLTSSGPYEVTAIRKEYVVLSNGTHEQFVAKSAVRTIQRKLEADASK